MIKNFWKGFAMGIANIVPGISGSAIALVFNLFDDLIFAVNNVFKDFKKSVLFLFPIVAGGVTAMGVLSTVVEHSLQHYSMPTTIFFTGLILGSVPFIWSRASADGFKITYLPYTIVAFVIVMIMTHFGSTETQTSEIIISTALLAELFVVGIFAASALVIPGISGTFIMILFGVYHIILSSISSFMIAVFTLDIPAAIHAAILLAPVGIGNILGALLASKLVFLLLKRAYSATYYSILGLTLGSVYSLLVSPSTYQSGVSPLLIVISIITGSAGIILAMKLGATK